YEPMGIGDPTPAGATTDREIYSPKTSVPLQANVSGSCQMPAIGYTNYSEVDSGTGERYAATWQELDEWPIEGAIVPVDILNIRKDAFDACIRQRIDLNLQAFITLWEN